MRTILLSILLIANSAMSQITSGLIAHWPLNGTCIEITSNTLPAKIYGDVTAVSDKFGNSCGAMHFANEGYIEIPHSNVFNQIGNSISICAWAKIDSSANNWWISILNKGYTNESNDSPAFRFQLTKVTIALTNLVPTWQIEYDKNIWHHWTITFNGSTLNAYMDAINIGSFDYPVNLQMNQSPLEIGRDITGNTESFNGCLDEVMIFNKELSSKEVRKIYEQVPNVVCSTNQCNLPNIIENFKVNWIPQPIIVKSKNLRLFAEATEESAHRIISINFNGINWKNCYLPRNRTCIYDVLLSNRCNYLVFKSINDLAVFKADIDGIPISTKMIETDTSILQGIQIIYEP